jgi:hypothetical protein
MAKGQKRSNREIKKPKQVKPKVPASGATSSTAQAKPDAAARGKKKW